MATPTPWSSEYLVNSVSTSSQQNARIAALSGGGFVITWVDYSGYAADPASADDPFEAALRGQLYTADGQRSGAPFLVNSTTTNSQFQPAITPLADGGFAVAWSDSSQSGGDTSSFAIRAQFFNAKGRKTQGELLINTTTQYAQFEPAIKALTNGDLIVVWTDFSGAGGDAFGSALKAQILAADGSRKGSEFLVNTTVVDSQSQPTIAALADGGFVVAWRDDSQAEPDPSNAAIRGQVFDASGATRGAEFLINAVVADSQSRPVITALSSGGFAVAWQDLSPGTLPAGSPGDVSGSAIKARLFNPDGTAASSELLVNTTTAGNQSEAAITALAGGRFLVSWTDALSGLTDDPAPGSALRAQAFLADGSRDGVEFLVNSSTAGNQWQASAATLVDGRVVVAWTDTSNATGTPDDNSSEVKARILEPRSTGVSLSGSDRSDDLIGTDFNDTMNGLGGNDRLFGDGGRDLLNGDSGNDRLNGGGGADVMNGGSGDDLYTVNSNLDQCLEALAAGRDEVRSGQISLDLNQSNLANIEVARLSGNANLNLIGSADDNQLVGNGGANILSGNGGSDLLTGAGGADVFVLSDVSAADTITDFVSGNDALRIRTSSLAIGNGNTVINGSVTRSSPGGFAVGAELVIFSANVGGPITVDNAASTIGSATTAYSIGATRLFAVDNGSQSCLFLFRATNADALVSATELHQLATLTSTPALALADLQFG